MGTFAIFGVILTLAVGWIPSAVAFGRNHPNKVPILLLNIFLGATIIGWVIALIWASMNLDKYAMNTINKTEQKTTHTTSEIRQPQEEIKKSFKFHECEKCGYSYTVRLSNCPQCGFLTPLPKISSEIPLKADSLTWDCKKCGEPNSKYNRVCKSCGADK
jgi:ribosomal protein L37E